MKHALTIILEVILIAFAITGGFVWLSLFGAWMAGAGNLLLVREDDGRYTIYAGEESMKRYRQQVER